MCREGRHGHAQRVLLYVWDGHRDCRAHRERMETEKGIEIQIKSPERRQTRRGGDGDWRER